jgi:hypothetical protein
LAATDRGDLHTFAMVTDIFGFDLRGMTVEIDGYCVVPEARSRDGRKHGGGGRKYPRA